MFFYPALVHMLGGIHAYSIILFEQESGGSNMGEKLFKLSSVFAAVFATDALGHFYNSSGNHSYTASYYSSQCTLNTMV